MLNELYLAVLYRPVAGKATGLLSRAIAKTQRDAPRAELVDALDACDKLAQTLRASLARYEPETLGLLSARQPLVLFTARVSGYAHQRRALSRGVAPWTAPSMFG